MKSVFQKILSYLEKHFKSVLIIFALLIVLSILGLFRLDFDNDVLSMLPDDEQIHKTIDFFHDSSISDKAVISVGVEEDVAGITKRLLSRRDLVSDVRTGPSDRDPMSMMSDIVDVYPQLCSDAAATVASAGADNIRLSVKKIYKILMNPGTGSMITFFRHDPLGFSLPLINAFKRLAVNSGYDVDVNGGRFISRDQQHALIILKTPVSVTDGFRSRELLAHINDSLGGIAATVVCAHRHTLSNEEIIKSDVKLVMIVAFVGFILLFALMFKDPGTVLVFLLPFSAVLFSLNISGLLLGSLSYFVAGFAAVIAGITLDYGIHVYVALKKRGGISNVAYIAGPVAVGALTTMSVFCAFFLSGVSGYRQLACFSVLSILIALLLALFFMPICLSKITSSETPENENRKTSIRRRSLKVGVWGGSLAVMCMLSWGIAFDANVEQFDGSDREILKAEDDFSAIWGGREKPAVFVVFGKTLEQALLANDKAYECLAANDALGDRFVSLSGEFFKSKRLRQRNLSDWMKVWSRERADSLLSDLKTAAAEYEFAESMFYPMESMLYAKKTLDECYSDDSLWKPLFERFIVVRDSGVKVLSFFDDKPQYVAEAERIAADVPGAYVVSRGLLSKRISLAVSSEIKKLAIIAGFFILVFIFIFLRSVREALLALVPVITATASSLSVLVLCGMKLSAVSLIALMVVVGLCIDYGIFMIHSLKSKKDLHIIKAVTLSALTTLIGAGALLFAVHPVMFAIGAVLFAGVLGGYLSAIFVVPSLYGMVFVK